MNRQKIQKMNEIHAVLLLIAQIVAQVTSDSVLGCGGFVKSHVPIDFSRVEVKLLTKQGILKDKINCAPTNGYYFVPLYDKGEYILELDPPPGWSFTPTKVNLVVDGVSDLCSQGKDIDFVFKGFGITGKVESFGSDTGPEGVEIELKSTSEERKTTTGPGGSFFFTPVYPGNYVLRISNPSIKVLKGSVTVVVVEGNTDLPAKSLVIQGYEVSGFVKNEAVPIKDVTIVLLTETKIETKVDGCDKVALTGFKHQQKYICHVKSNENGLFKFGTLPNGRYTVTPFYNGHNIYYQPNSIEFIVNHKNIQLPQNFEIIGFSINGRVLKGANDAPLSKAKVFLNDKQVAITGTDGLYKLEKLRAGTYTIKASADGYLFKETSVTLNPNLKQVPDVFPIAYEICGSVVSDKSLTVTFAQIGSTRMVTTLSDRTNGKFCEFLQPGKYQVQVVVDIADSQKGLQFFPKVQTIEVTSKYVGSIIFSQLKATVTGKVQCIQKSDCQGLKVILKPSGDSSAKNIVIDLSNGSYEVADVYPGIYEIVLSDNRFCWVSNQQTVNVNSVQVQVPAFTQSGYSVVFVSSHDSEATYKLPGQPTEITIKLPKNRLNHCLALPGAYTFRLSGCHRYESETLTYSTDDLTNEIFFNALKHTTTLTVASERKHGDVTATINIDGVKTQTGPLPFKTGGYEISLLLGPDDTAVIIPHSEILYFVPPLLSLSGSSDCVNLPAKFQALVGIVFKGKIIPPLAGVQLSVETDNSDALLAETDDKGVYKFPPLEKSKSYKVTAKKESFVLVGPNEEGNFLAHKLAEIVIQVLDKSDKTPLQGALLSLSGSDGYRSNLQSNEIGKITFNSLSPGEYFLRPMMKEYSFEPSSKIIAVKEGQTVNVQLSGTRVAYSAYGQVTSLNREPEEGIVVVASGTGNCSQFSEETTSEATGYFRIRGLQPFCGYSVTVKTGPKDKHLIERSAPTSIKIERVTKDIEGLELVIFRSVNNMDLLVRVFAQNPEHYKSLRLKVLREFSAVVFSGRVETAGLALNSNSNHGILVHVPPIPVDGKTYSVHLESSLNNKLEQKPEVFAANTSFKYVEFDFVVRGSIAEQDIMQTSVWTLVFIFALMLAVYNIDKVSQSLRERFGSYVTDFVNNASVKKSGGNDFVVDNDDIDQIVQSINAVKRKPKAKKVI